MANNRDIRLTIKARDEASVVIAKVTEALSKQAVGGQRAAKDLIPLGDRFRRLTSEASKLQDTMTRAKGQVEVSRRYQIIGTSLATATAEHAKLRAEIDGLSVSIARETQRLESNTAARTAARDALSGERKELSAARRDVDRHTKAIGDATQAAAKYEAEIADKTQKLAQYRTSLDAARAAQERARNEDERAVRTSEVLAARISDLRAAREAQRKTLTGRDGVSARTDRITNLADKYEDPWMRVAARGFQEDEGSARDSLVKYDAEIARITALKDAADRARASTSENLKNQSGVVSDIESSIRKVYSLKSAQDSLAAAKKTIAENSAALETAKQKQAQYEVAVGVSEAAVSALSSEVQIATNEIQRMEGAQRKLQKANDGVVNTVSAAEDAMSKLNAAAAQNGFGKLDADIVAAERRLSRLEAKLQESLALTEKLSKYSDGSGGFTGSSDAAKLRALNDQLTAAKNDAASFRGEIEKLRLGLSGAGRNSQQTKDEIKALAQALAAAEGDARKFSEEIREVGIRSGTMKRGLVDAWRAHNAETRTALSLQQRIRGQILSMIAAYGGLFGVVSLVQSVTQAYMTQEAALSRLGVVFDGNQQRMAVELGWIRREAARLGIEFGVLADQYTKFAVSGKESGFDDAAIRQIFTSVSEAARVNKLGIEEIKGIYLALSQMISKGKISAEELRQQLGERLPGAMALMAKALNVTVSELDDMMKKGDALATQDNMLKFAAVLEKQFGSQLPKALDTFTTEWGRLQNTIYSSRLTIGEGGLISALTDSMRKLNDYAASKEGVDFFLALGNAMGSIVSYLPTLMENFETIVKVFKVIVTIPIITFFSRWLVTLRGLGAAFVTSLMAIRGAPAAFGAMTLSMRASTSAMGTMAIAARGLGAALMTLGPIAAGIALASMAFSATESWSEGVDDIVQLQAQHERIMDNILAAYDAAKDKTYDWKDAIDSKNESEIAASLTPNIDAYKSLVSDFLSQFQAELTSLGREGTVIDDLKIRFNIDPESVSRLKSSIAAASASGYENGDALVRLTQNIREFAEAIPDRSARDVYIRMADHIDKMVASGIRVSQITTMMREMGFAVDDAEGIAANFPTTMEEMANGIDDAGRKVDKFEQAMIDKFIRPLEDALNEANAFGANLTGLDLETKIKSPFDEGEASIKSMLVALNTLKVFMPQLGQAFRDFSENGGLDKLEQKLSWMKNIPVLGDMFDRFIGDTISGSIAEGEVTQDFEAQIGSSRAADLERIVRASNKVAAELGISAKDLITTFGYETRGTYDKWQKGPTTQWGEHRGLIQWGTGDGGAAQEFGVTAQMSIEAQIDAVGRYLKARGVKPGMGLLEIYSAINAGRVGRINASDANNGGAPGTVLDKVNSKAMADHAANAGKLMELYGHSAEYGERIGKANADAATEAEKAAKAKRDEAQGIEQTLAIETMRVAGKEREAFIQEKINAYVAKHGEMSSAELANLTEQYGKMYDLQNMKTKAEQHDEKVKAHQEEINRLEAERNALMEQREQYSAQGNSDKVAEIDKALVSVNGNLDASIDRFIAFWKAAGGEESAAAIAQLEAMKLKLKETRAEALLTAEQVNERTAAGLTNAFAAMAEALANGKSGIEGFRDAFLTFAGEFLVEIGKMIMQQAILNALQNGGGSGGGFGGWIMSGLSAITGGIFHTGKAPGQSMGNMSRKVSPALFNNAPRFHTGKLPGLRQGEMAAIITEDEEVIPPSDPRHAWNNSGDQKAAPSESSGMTIINAIDAEQLLEAALKTDSGQKMLLNKIRLMAPQIKQALT